MTLTCKLKVYLSESLCFQYDETTPAVAFPVFYCFDSVLEIAQKTFFAFIFPEVLFEMSDEMENALLQGV